MAISAVTTGDDERRDDGERQRDLDGEGGAGADGALNIDRPSDAFDVRSHHVHSDASAGDVRHRCRCGEPRPEDQRNDVAIAALRCLFARQEALLDRLATDDRRVDARTVVADLHQDLAAFVACRQRHDAFGRLAGSDASLGGFEAVVDGVADQVGQRVADRFEQGLVEFRVAPDHLQSSRLSARCGEVANDPRELVPHILDRLHTCLHHVLLQLTGDQIESLAGGDERRVLLRLGVAQDLIARQHEFADAVHQVVEQRHVDSDGLGNGVAFFATFLADQGSGHIYR
jgi:hypothetical protein